MCDVVNKAKVQEVSNLSSNNNLLHAIQNVCVCLFTAGHWNTEFL